MPTPETIPHVAPLPIPLALYLIEQQSEQRRPLARSLEEEIEQARQQYLGEWERLTLRVRPARDKVVKMMTPPARTSAFSTDWVLQALAETKRPVTATALSRWRDQGLVRYIHKDHPETDSVGSTLISWMLAARNEQRWRLPTIEKEEPYWWCWRQDTPNAPAVPCPIPLPEDLPPSALLWTPWAGAAWSDPAWLRAGRAGSIRWAGTIVEGGKLLWNVTEADLQMWDPSALTYDPGVLDSASDVLHVCASMALVNIAMERLKIPV